MSYDVAQDIPMLYICSSFCTLYMCLLMSWNAIKGNVNKRKKLSLTTVTSFTRSSSSRRIQPTIHTSIHPSILFQLEQRANSKRKHFLIKKTTGVALCLFINVFDVSSHLSIHTYCFSSDGMESLFFCSLREKLSWGAKKLLFCLLHYFSFRILFPFICVILHNGVGNILVLLLLLFLFLFHGCFWQTWRKKFSFAVDNFIAFSYPAPPPPYH